MTQLIGRTPMVMLDKKKYGLKSDIILKLESFNPSGSAKDRIALNMVEALEDKLTPDSILIEPTSGNTGIGLAMVAAVKGLKAIIVMPDTMSKERIQAITAYGATVVLTPGAEGMAGSIKKAEELLKTHESAFILGQFTNPENPNAHYKTTGREIWVDTDGNIDFFVAGIGTGGTISGTGAYLKEQNGNIRIVGVEPLSSPLLTEGTSGQHKLQGIGANFVPDTLNRELLDEVLTVSDEDAYKFTKMLAQKEGILVGISSGAALCGAFRIAEKEENKRIVVLLADNGNRYFSTGVFD